MEFYCYFWHSVLSYMKIKSFILALTLTGGVPLAQSHPNDITPDTTTTLQEVVVEGNVRGNYLSHNAVEKREMITVTGLKKMACCTLAESFENSASVSVGYSDAVSGARQIRMLGLAGVYTQFLDESRPTMRGLVSPYALNYTPGDWLQSIQVSKGVTSVTTGHDAITGQINLEYRKPTDDERLHVNFYLDDMLRPEVNLTSAIHFKEDKSLATIIMAHGSLDTDWREMRAMDRNHDGFRDMPRTRQADVANRWVWLAPSGMQLRWGARYTAEDRLGGQVHYNERQGSRERREFFDIFDHSTPMQREIGTPLSTYGSRATNHDASAYVKAAMPLRHTVTDGEGSEWQDNVALLADWSHFDTRSYFGYNEYNAHENAVTTNLRFDHYFAPQSMLAVGLQGRLDYVRGAMRNFCLHTMQGGGYSWHNAVIDEDMDERELGAYAEWNYTLRDRLTLVAGARVDYNDWARQWLVTPRLHVKWDITPRTTLRASAGLGSRTPRALIETLGMMATGYTIMTGRFVLPEQFDIGYVDADWLQQLADKRDYRRMERALTVGGSLTQTFALGRDRNASLSLDYFHTHFYHSLIASQEPWGQSFLLYNSDGRNDTHVWQLDFNWSPIERLDVLATFRYNYTRIELPMVESYSLPHDPTHGTYYRLSHDTQTVERPLTSRFKGVLNVSYATRFRIWVFDITGQLNGPARVPGGGHNTVNSYHSPTYGQLFAQVTHKIGHAEVYVGCENITDYRQKMPIFSADAPFSAEFNSMNIWGPLMGRKFYVGMRWNLY